MMDDTASDAALSRLAVKHTAVTPQAVDRYIDYCLGVIAKAKMLEHGSLKDITETITIIEKAVWLRDFVRLRSQGNDNSHGLGALIINLKGNTKESGLIRENVGPDAVAKASRRAVYDAFRDDEDDEVVKLKNEAAAAAERKSIHQAAEVLLTDLYNRINRGISLALSLASYRIGGLPHDKLSTLFETLEGLESDLALYSNINSSFLGKSGTDSLFDPTYGGNAPGRSGLSERFTDYVDLVLPRTSGSMHADRARPIAARISSLIRSDSKGQ